MVFDSAGDAFGERRRFEAVRLHPPWNAGTWNADVTSQRKEKYSVESSTSSRTPIGPMER